MIMDDLYFDIIYWKQYKLSGFGVVCKGAVVICRMQVLFWTREEVTFCGRVLRKEAPVNELFYTNRAATLFHGFPYDYAYSSDVKTLIGTTNVCRLFRIQFVESERSRMEPRMCGLT
uniref:Polysacc_synt_4 domain-containing protein n=1 Tax=Steinernema glaseri TaxID=37863 RepID=A0A1I7XWN2_9BILA